MKIRKQIMFEGWQHEWLKEIKNQSRIVRIALSHLVLDRRKRKVDYDRLNFKARKRSGK